jgi:hypothetical protein
MRKHPSFWRGRRYRRRPDTLRDGLLLALYLLLVTLAAIWVWP